MTTTWNITHLERAAASGGVVLAHWRATAVDGEDVASAYNTVEFTPDPTSPDFTPYEELTEADVLGWIWKIVKKEEVESKLAAEITAQRAPATVSGLPW